MSQIYKALNEVEKNREKPDKNRPGRHDYSHNQFRSTPSPLENRQSKVNQQRNGQSDITSNKLMWVSLCLFLSLVVGTQLILLASYLIF